MSPLAWSIVAATAPIALAIALVVKWWTIWFILGQNFTRTSVMCLSALVLSKGVPALVVASGALGVGAADSSSNSEGLHGWSWITAWLVLWSLTLVFEWAWLRFCMARLVRPDWRWRTYDRAGFAVAHLVIFGLVQLEELWRAGAFRVS